MELLLEWKIQDSNELNVGRVSAHLLLGMVSELVLLLTSFVKFLYFKHSRFACALALGSSLKNQKTLDVIRFT